MLLLERLDAEKIDALRNSGAKPLILDALGKDAVLAALQSERPDVVVHQLTAIPAQTSLRRFDREFAQTNCLRTERTDNLIVGVRAAGVRRFIAQSFAG
jgi:nucleoside-diphosphate-sugar epimerase